jgi:hypothetical protein|tara:strand:+ start:5676 stop:6119 length:444 start_codon:yes stop_codon:yes gene_type:complete
MSIDVKLNQEEFGDINETSFYNLLKHNGITNITQTDKYSPYDFKIKLGDKIIYIELKTRTIKREQYDTTILAKNKIDFFIDIPKRNKVFYAIFGFITEKKQMEYYYIKYDEDLFNSYEKQAIFNKQHFKIPITDLTHISNLYHQLGT